MEYDFSILGRNREILKEYWRESVEQNRDFEVSYTVGMRGIHDRPHWDWDTAQTPTGGSSGEYCTMGETLMQRRRVEEEGLRIVNSLYTQ